MLRQWSHKSEAAYITECQQMELDGGWMESQWTLTNQEIKLPIIAQK